jgi:hypothetical protein
MVVRDCGNEITHFVKKENIEIVFMRVQEQFSLVVLDEKIL